MTRSRWRCLEHSIAVREAPDIAADRLNHSLHPGEEFDVREELEGTDGVLYLRLAHYSGWVFNYPPSVGKMCARIAPMLEEDRFPKDSAAFRHWLPECQLQAGVALTSSQQTYFTLMAAIPVCPTAMLQLQEHGFLPRKDIPSEPFHAHFPRGAQVNRYESTTAYAYTAGGHFACSLNEAMTKSSWSEFFKSYGYIAKCLQSYCDKMQDLYGESRTLFRGLSLPASQILSNYWIGSTFAWASFTSTTDEEIVAMDFAVGSAQRKGNVPVLFEIHTMSRGAPLLEWSEYPYEREFLLLPFQGFQVEGVNEFKSSGYEGIRVMLQTVKLGPH